MQNTHFNPEMLKFYQTKIVPAFSNLNLQKYPVVYQNYQENMRMIFQRYGCAPHFEVLDGSLTDPSEDLWMPAACGVKKGKITVAVFVAEFKKLYDILTASSIRNANQMFDLYVIIVLMHELDHLALGIVGDPQEVRTLPEQVESELVVHARTSQNTLTPLIEFYHEELSASQMVMHSEWIRCGRNLGSVEWKLFIESIYSKIRM